MPDIIGCQKQAALFLAEQQQLNVENKVMCQWKGPFSPIIRLWSIPDCLKHQSPQGKNFAFKIWILQMIKLRTVVVGNQRKLCSVHKCPLLLLAQEDITIQHPCHQEHLGNALHLLLHGTMIREARAHLNLFLFLQAPHACLPILYSGKRGSCQVVGRLGKYTWDSTGAQFDFEALCFSHIPLDE